MNEQVLPWQDKARPREERLYDFLAWKSREGDGLYVSQGEIAEAVCYSAVNKGNNP